MTSARHTAERSTAAVAWITAAMMVVEIWAGWRFNSMALLADGWHMSTHALAIGLSAVAYAVMRHYADDPRFASGTRKIEALAAYTSALVLLGIAMAMVGASVTAFIAPKPIAFAEAIGIASIGLAVNIGCAFILGAAHHPSAHGHAHRDLNLRSAYLHVLADAATSVFALVALVGGKLFGWNWLDPAMGIAGAVLVAAWAYGLLKDAIRVLLDIEPAQVNHSSHYS
ncbi:MAG: cation transporter [Sulfuricella sp.]|nr:cation transporter [Sulfuricella sp.]